MKQIVYSILSMSLLIGSSCTKEECEPGIDNTLTPVSFSPELADIQQIDTRATKTTWAQGDQIAIFSDIAVKGDGNTSTASIAYTRGATEGTWTPPSALEQWYFADAIRTHNFYAYYPAGTATSYTSVELPDISGQDGTKTVQALKEENDFMRGTGQATKGNIAASIQMFRVFAIINLKVKLKQDAFTGNAATLTDITLISTNSLPLVNSSSTSKATVDLSNGHVTCTNGLSTVTLHPASGINLTPTTEVSIPIKIYPQQSTIQVLFTIGGKTSTAQTLSTTNFIGGRIYNYSVVINEGLDDIGVGDPIIFDWLNYDGSPVNPVIPS